MALSTQQDGGQPFVINVFCPIRFWINEGWQPRGFRASLPNPVTEKPQKENPYQDMRCLLPVVCRGSGSNISLSTKTVDEGRKSGYNENDQFSK